MSKNIQDKKDFEDKVQESVGESLKELVHRRKKPSFINILVVIAIIGIVMMWRENQSATGLAERIYPDLYADFVETPLDLSYHEFSVGMPVEKIQYEQKTTPMLDELQLTGHPFLAFLTEKDIVRNSGPVHSVYYVSRTVNNLEAHISLYAPKQNNVHRISVRLLGFGEKEDFIALEKQFVSHLLLSNGVAEYTAIHSWNNSKYWVWHRADNYMGFQTHYSPGDKVFQIVYEYIGETYFQDINAYLIGETND